MIIFEHKDVGKVCVLGTCRVINPLRDYITANGGVMKLTYPNTLTQCPQESQQLIEFVQGREVPSELWDVLYGSEVKPEYIPKNAPELIDECDFFVSETSNPRFTIGGGYFFSANYLSTVFVRGGGMGMLNWYRKLSAAPSSEETVQEALKGLRESGRQITDLIEQVLRETVHVSPSETEFQDFNIQLANKLGGKWLMVPIFRIKGALERHVQDREAITKLVKSTAKKSSQYFYDPSNIINKYGREAALAGNGVDVFHYATEFNPTAGKIFFNQIKKMARKN